MEVESSSPHQHFARKSLAERVSKPPAQLNYIGGGRNDWINGRRAPYESRAPLSTPRSTNSPQSEDVIQASIAIEIVYSEGQRMKQIRSFKEERPIVSWLELRRGITSDLHGGGLTSPSLNSYRILRNGHVFAFWTNSNPQLYKTLYSRLQTAEKERFLKLNVAAIYVMEQCEVVLFDVPFQSHVAEKGSESIFRFSRTLDRIIPTAPRAHLNAQQTFDPSVQAHVQESPPSQPLNGDVVLGVTHSPNPTKRSREYLDEAENPVAKKPQIQRLVVDEGLQETQILPNDKDYGDLSNIAGIEKALRFARSQMENFISPRTKSSVEKNPSCALSALQKLCRDKICFLELLMKSFRESLTQSQILAERETSLSAMEEKLCQAEEAASRNQRLQEQGFYEQTSQLHMMEEQLKDMQKEKEDALQSRDHAEELIQEVRKAAEEQVKIALGEKKAAEEGYVAERDRRISAEETLASVLKIVSEMDTIFGDSNLKLPKERVRAEDSRLT